MSLKTIVGSGSGIKFKKNRIRIRIRNKSFWIRNPAKYPILKKFTLNTTTIFKILIPFFVYANVKEVFKKYNKKIPLHNFSSGGKLLELTCFLVFKCCFIYFFCSCSPQLQTVRYLFFPSA